MRNEKKVGVNWMFDISSSIFIIFIIGCIYLCYHARGKDGAPIPVPTEKIVTAGVGTVEDDPMPLRVSASRFEYTSSRLHFFVDVGTESTSFFIENKDVVQASYFPSESPENITRTTYWRSPSYEQIANDAIITKENDLWLLPEVREGLKTASPLVAKAMKDYYRQPYSY